MAYRAVVNQAIFNKAPRITSCFASFQNYYSKDMFENSKNVIDFENLKDKLGKHGMTLIDVREPAELKNDGKIPDSVNIPLGEVAEAFKMTDSMFRSKYGVPKPDMSTNPFVLSCRSGKRATDAFQKLQLLGYSNALIYTGSFQDWVKNGGAVEK